MMDAFRIAFEQQLRRVGENVLRQAENDRQQPYNQRHEGGKSMEMLYKSIFNRSLLQYKHKQCYSKVII